MFVDGIFTGKYGEHWIGNDIIHFLTNQGDYSLRIDMVDWDRKKYTAIYEYFKVDDEKNAYRLHVGGFSGNAGDGMSKHNKQQFSTRDKDHDKAVKNFDGNCAKRFHGAWWFYNCYKSNLNGKYYRNNNMPEGLYDGIIWKPLHGSKYTMKTVEMKIRPRLKDT